MKYLIFTFLFAMLATTAFASQNKAQVVIRLQAPNGNIDEATLYFDNGINPVYVYQEDAQKVFSGVAGVPALFSLSSDSVDCSINGYGASTTTQEIALGYDVDADGLYDISTPLLDNLAATSIIRLEDRLLGTFTDLRQSKYTAQLLANDSATGRFYVHVSAPVQATLNNAGCANDNGVITVAPDNSVTWTSCTLLDAFNNQVATFNNVNAPISFDQLGEGTYYMVYAFGNYTATQEFQVNGHFVVTNITASKTSVEVGEMIDFTAAASNAHDFNWDFGDGTLISGVANPRINYTTPGDYLVNLRSANDYGCEDNAQINITVTSATISGISEQKAAKASVFASAKNVTVNLNNTVSTDAQMNVYNLIGQEVYTASLNNQTEVVSLDEQPNGCYIVSVRNAGVVSTKRIFISK